MYEKYEILLISRLIALLFGRLRLSVPEAIDKYRILAEQVFSKKNSPGRDGTFKASNLVKAVKTVVEEKLGLGHADEKMFSTNGGCKTQDLSILSGGSVNNSLLGSCVLSQQSISTKSLGYFVLGQRIKSWL